MIEQIEHIKKFALQDNSALTVKQFGEAIARMCDDAIREAAEQSVQADGAEAAANGLVYKIEWVDADTIRLTPRR